MDANKYQQLAWQTAKPFYKNTTGTNTFKELQKVTACLALAGEAGQLGNTLKRIMERGGGIDYKDIESLREELGAVQWYVAHVATLLDIKLEDVMGQNISKLQDRYGEGAMSK